MQISQNPPHPPKSFSQSIVISLPCRFSNRPNKARSGKHQDRPPSLLQQRAQKLLPERGCSPLRASRKPHLPSPYETCVVQKHLIRPTWGGAAPDSLTLKPHVTRKYLVITEAAISKSEGLRNCGIAHPRPPPETKRWGLTRRSFFTGERRKSYFSTLTGRHFP